uniref:Uncharacterized protein n=2 Tax=unclassified Mycobacterium TaxID=2642494 RepID=A0A5Q5BFS4_MYCSS
MTPGKKTRTWRRWLEDANTLPSLRENDEYFIVTHQLALLGSIYDPDGTYANDPTGLPPHVVSERQEQRGAHRDHPPRLDPPTDRQYHHHQQQPVRRELMQRDQAGEQEHPQHRRPGPSRQHSITVSTESASAKATACGEKQSCTTQFSSSATMAAASAARREKATTRDMARTHSATSVWTGGASADAMGIRPPS